MNAESALPRKQKVTKYESVSDRVSIYQRGHRWYANFQIGKQQRRVSLQTSSKKEARTRALRLGAELETGRWRPQAADFLIGAAVTAYQDFLRAEGRAHKTLVKYDRILARVLELAASQRRTRLVDLNLQFVDGYRRSRVDAGVAPKTLYTEIVVIRQLMNFALSRDLLPHDPLRGLKIKKPRRSEQPCWTRPQVETILAAAPTDIRAALTLLADTGMRFGELQWLTWDDVDLERGVLHIRPKEGWKPKTGDQRSVPLSTLAKRTLVQLTHEYRWVVTAPPSPQYAGADRQLSERRLLTALKAVLKQVGLVGKLHTFRHAFISHALLQRVPEAVVRQWVGHIDAEVLRHYTHIHDEASQLQMKRLEQANEGRSPEQET